MGAYISSTYWEWKKPEYLPLPDFTPTFDPNFGFKAPRKPRVSKLSEQEMKALQIKPENRDYCAHFIRDYMICMRQYKPFQGFCYPELHNREHCIMDDWILRMKEYEREKRLRLREMRKQGKVIQ